jgi:ABC-type Na+ efflux pump permease subunit
MTTISQPVELPAKRAVHWNWRPFRGESLLGGPILFYDMLRTGRRGRYMIVRTIYGLLLLSTVALVVRPSLEYASIARPHFGTNGQLIGVFPGTMTANDLAQIAGKFFVTVLLIQFLAVICLTPAYAASAITEERDRRILEYLLATDLSSREIILGKFFSRLANLTLLLLTGLPMVALSQLLGGVDLNVVLMTYAATLLFTMTLASLSILSAVHSRRTRGAIMETYVILAVYLVVPPIIYSAAGAVWPLNYGLRFLNSGNPFYLALETGSGSQSVVARLLGSLAQFAEFHIVATIGLLWWAARRLRRAPARTDRKASKTSAVVSGSPRKTRHVWGPPMVWKEMAIRGLPERRVASRLLVTLTILVAFLPVVPVLFEPDRRYRIEDLNLCVRFYGTILSIILLIAILLRASHTISIERSKQTLEILRITPLSTAQIFWGKWLGTILSMRHGLVCLAIVWALGLATNALHPLALIALVVAMTIYAAACASIGILASVFARTPMLARIVAIVVAVSLAAGQALMLTEYAPQLPILPGTGTSLVYVVPPDLALIMLIGVILVYAVARLSIGIVARVFPRRALLVKVIGVVLAACLALGQTLLLAQHASQFQVRPATDIPFLYLLPPAVITLLAFPGRAWIVPWPIEDYFRRGTDTYRESALPLIAASLFLWLVSALVFYLLAKRSFRHRENRHPFAPLRIRKKLTKS